MCEYVLGHLALIKRERGTPHMPKAPPKRSRLVTIPRDSILFFSGLLGVLHETLFVKSDRPQLLLLFAAMMGLPAFLRADEARKTGGEDDEK